MSQRIKISGKETPLSLESLPQRGWKFSVRPGGWVIAESNDGIRKRFMLSEKKNQFSLSVNGRLWLGELLESSHEVSNQNDRTSGNSDLVAQFPGKVRKVLVQEGLEVKEGENLLLIEAMKMEFSIRAPFSGKVVQVFVKEGQQLSPGDQFLELEAILTDG